MSFGIKDESESVTKALNRAQQSGIITLASASNEGANDCISFPARLNNIFCIGSADGKGFPSSFSPPYRDKEKYSTLGEEVLGAIPVCNSDLKSEAIYGRRSGTSTALAVATGIVALLIDYTRQFLPKGKGADNRDNLRKIFLKMSDATAGECYRYLALKYFFGLKSHENKDTRFVIKEVLAKPIGKILAFFVLRLTL
jgi:Subtilase family